MDDPELTLDQGIFRSQKISEAKLDTKEQKHNSESNEERNSEVSSHQDSGDTGPTVEQESSEKSGPGKAMPDPSLKTDREMASLRPRELMDQSQQAALAGSVTKNSPSLRKTPHRCSQWLAGQEPHLSSQPAVGQAAPPVGLLDEVDATWISQRTGQEMKCNSQQTSGAWELKPLSALLQPERQESQINQDVVKRGEWSVSDERERVLLYSGETTKTTDQPAAQDPSHSGEQWEQRDLPSEAQPDDQSPQPDSRHRQDEAHQDSPQPEEWNPWWNPRERSNSQAVPGAPKSSQLQPTNANAADLKVEITWLSQQNSQDVKCKTPQTDLFGELSETPSAANQEPQEARDEKHTTWQLHNVGSKTNRQMTLSYSEGEEDIQQTYSIISLEEGIVLNRRTRKILISCSQQTSDTLLLSASGAAGPEHHPHYRGPSKGVTVVPVSAEASEQHPEGEDLPGERDAERVRTPSQQSYNESQESGYWSQTTQDKDSECDSEYVERFPSNQHLSEEALFRIESSLSIVPMEEDTLSIYEGDSEKEGSFINRNTGKLLDSQCLQTEESFFQGPGRCKGGILMP